MSVWAHFLGIIRFDSYTKNVSPQPKNVTDLLDQEKRIIKSVFSNLPDDLNMSEGLRGKGLEISFVDTERGLTVVLTGDIRDFCEKDVKNIFYSWLKDCIDNFQEKVRESDNHYIQLLSIRDAVIRCDVEGYGKYIIFDIEYDAEKDRDIVLMREIERRLKNDNG